jgi:hypothetical protein
MLVIDELPPEERGAHRGPPRRRSRAHLPVHREEVARGGRAAFVLPSVRRKAPERSAIGAESFAAAFPDSAWVCCTAGSTLTRAPGAPVIRCWRRAHLVSS